MSVSVPVCVVCFCLNLVNVFAWNGINIFALVLKAQLGIKLIELNWIQALDKRILTEREIWMSKNTALIHPHTHQWKIVDMTKNYWPCSAYTFGICSDCLWTMVGIKFDSHVFKPQTNSRYKYHCIKCVNAVEFRYRIKPVICENNSKWVFYAQNRTFVFLLLFWGIIYIEIYFQCMDLCVWVCVFMCWIDDA